MVIDKAFTSLSHTEINNIKQTHPNKLVTLIDREIDSIIEHIPDLQLRLRMQQRLWSFRGEVSKMNTPGGKLIAYITFLRSIKTASLQCLKGDTNEL